MTVTGKCIENCMIERPNERPINVNDFIAYSVQSSIKSCLFPKPRTIKTYLIARFCFLGFVFGLSVLLVYVHLVKSLNVISKENIP